MKTEEIHKLQEWIEQWLVDHNFNPSRISWKVHSLALQLVADRDEYWIDKLAAKDEEWEKKMDDAIDESYVAGLVAYQSKQFPDDPSKAVEESDRIDEEILARLKKQYLLTNQNESNRVKN